MGTDDAKPTETEEIRLRLWNADVGAGDYEAGGEKYQAAILEQYKLYIEMADRVSARRGLTNTFFLSINTAIFTLIGLFWKDRPQIDSWALAIPLAIALGQCTAWWWLVRSYRQLNAAKFKVAGVLEERLPASPFWKAEWYSLGEGKDWSKYLPLTHLEQWVPVLFGLAYLVGFVGVVAA
jgi:hypothetical protein